MKNFIALDFETANRTNRHSVCSVGIAVVENGKIVDQIYSLINPEEEFDPLNIEIHGITERDVKNAPTFPEFYEEVRDLLEGSNMFAHNLSFDGYVLRDVLKKYNVPSASHQLLCTLQLAKALWVGYDSYRLNDLSRQRGIKLPKHHHAMNDAIACAELFIQMQEEFSLYTLEDIEEKTGFLYGQITPNTFRSFTKAKPKARVKVSAIESAFEASVLTTRESEQQSLFLLEEFMDEKNVMAPQTDFYSFTTREEYEELGRSWGLFGVNPKETFLYKGDGWQETVTLAGYQTYGKKDENHTIVVQFQDGSLGCIHPGYLKEMQAKSFKRTISEDS